MISVNALRLWLTGSREFSNGRTCGDPFSLLNVFRSGG
jgi:hypothetical protein